jgi:hypothetical protein
MRIWILSNTNAKRMLFEYEYGSDVFQYEMDSNNKIVDSYLIVSQVYSDIIHNSLKSNNKKNTFDHFATFFS